jgi:hypothetical protein
MYSVGLARCKVATKGIVNSRLVVLQTIKVGIDYDLICDKYHKISEWRFYNTLRFGRFDYSK